MTQDWSANSCAPVLLIGWNRPAHIKKVINILAVLQPQEVYFACDGPKPNDRASILDVEKTRRTAEAAINWTNPHFLYQSRNLVCRIGVSTAISWFFERVEAGIVIEDDCQIHPDFLLFSSQLLDLYATDTRVWCITASNYQHSRVSGSSYYFSRYNHCWGWASWRRCWSHYDVDLTTLDKFISRGLLRSVAINSAEVKYWTQIWKTLRHSSHPDTWDYQWTYTCFVNNGLTITPNINLVNNIGYGPNATHTKFGTSPATLSQFALGTSGVLPLKHPPFIVPDINADLVVSKKFFAGSRSLPRRLASVFLRLLK